MNANIWVDSLGEVKLSPLEARILKEAEQDKRYSEKARAIVEAATRFAEWKYR